MESRAVASQQDEAINRWWESASPRHRELAMSLRSGDSVGDLLTGMVQAGIGVPGTAWEGQDFKFEVPDRVIEFLERKRGKTA